MTFLSKDDGSTMVIRGKSKAKIRFIIKIIGFVLIIYVVISAFKLRPDISKYPREIVNILDSNHNSDVNIRDVLLKISKSKKEKPLEDCSIPRLKHHIGSTNKSNVPACQRIYPVAGSCTIAKSLFLDTPKGTCAIQKQIKVCSFKSNTKEVVCNKGKCDALQLGIRRVETGELEWKDLQSAKTLQLEITKLLETQNNGYCYIKCEHGEQETPAESDTDYPYSEHKWRTSDLENVQLLLLPPSVKPQKKIARNITNVNLIFIDSVSRHHFFRSLPSTINLFEEINSGSDAVVLDYELVQAIRSRTFETLNSLFGGHVPENDKTFGILDMPPEPLKVEGLFSLFQDAGYDTLWLEDLCFEWEWGISKDLCVHDKSLTVEQTWKKLKKAFSKAGIGSFGMSTANCEILAHNGVNDHFHGPDTVCFNGRHQHEYHLDYLRYYQEAMIQSNQPFLTFLETNVGHEDTGRRIQTLDVDLKNYLKFAIQQDNMLTILLSDHGNTYGKFIDISSEGRVEIYHPAMFIFIPQKLAQQFGKNKMAAIILNQQRLVSHLDLHYTIKSLVTNTNIPDMHKQYEVSPKGLFQPLSKSRQCSRVPQIPPNFCICEGGESRITNTSQHVLYAHFAVGMINNAIQSQFRRTHPVTLTGFGSCRRLELVSFQHVRKAVNLDNTVTLTMDLLFKTGDPSYNHYEVFMVSIQSETSSGHMTLIKSDRLSPYKKYADCVDHGVQLQLCVCNITKKQTQTQDHLLPLSDTSISRRSLLMETDISFIDGSDACLLSINQKSKEGFTVSLMNVCTYIQIQVTLTVRVENVNLSDKSTQQCYLRPGEIKFLLAGVVTDARSPWHSSYSVQFYMTQWP